jgi:hypothetical protein
MTSPSSSSSGADASAPFASLGPVLAIAALYAVGVFVWMSLGDHVPGGRWFAVHLFTLGVLSNLVVALSHHFTRTLLNVPSPGGQRGRFLLVNVGAVGVLAGFPITPVLAGAVTAITVAVGWLLLDLTKMARAAPSDHRFMFVVRGYQWACIAFLVGALLGLLMGAAWLPGQWVVPSRFAHLHLNLLGWGGLTLLATVVFYGPTIMRARMDPAAERRAPRALGLAAGGLAVAAAGLVAIGLGGDAATVARMIAAAGIAVYATGATMIVVPILRSTAVASAQTWLIRGASAWFLLVVWANAGIVGVGRWRLLDALGVALVVGVLAQAILAALGNLAPMVWARGRDARADARDRLERFPRLRPAVLNLGAIAVVVAAFLGRQADLGGAIVARSGWVLVAIGALAQLALVVTARRRP